LLTQAQDPSMYISTVAGMTGISPCPAIGWEEVSGIFCLGLAWILWISASQVARITEMSHWHPAQDIIFKSKKLSLNRIVNF
jgi:hypothetical protein